jgi:hypothetical protein
MSSAECAADESGDTTATSLSALTTLTYLMMYTGHDVKTNKLSLSLIFDVLLVRRSREFTLVELDALLSLSLITHINHTQTRCSCAAEPGNTQCLVSRPAPRPRSVGRSGRSLMVTVQVLWSESTPDDGGKPVRRAGPRTPALYLRRSEPCIACDLAIVML